MQNQNKNPKPQFDHAKYRNQFHLRLLFGMELILWLAFVALLQFPVYDFLSQRISNQQSLMNLASILFLIVYVAGAVAIVYRARNRYIRKR